MDRLPGPLTAIPAPAALDRGALVRLAGLAIVARGVVLVALFFAGRHTGDSFSTLVTRFDGGYYRSIAEHGYPVRLPVDAAGRVEQNPAGFFPLFPLVVRAVMAISGASFVVAATVVNVVLAVGASLAVYAALAQVLPSAVAAWSSALWTVWPLSTIFSLAYSEALFTLLAALGLYWLLRRNYLAAGLAALLASATRPNGVVLALAALVALVLAIRAGNRSWRPWAATALSPLGAVAFLAYLWVRTGRADAWFVTESQGWGVGTDGGWNNLLRVGRYVHAGRWDGLFVVFLVLLAVAAAVLAARDRLDPVLLTYALGVLVLALITRNDLSSVPRFSFVAFPLFVPVARRLLRAHPAARYGWLALSFPALIATAVFLTTRSHYPP